MEKKREKMDFIQFIMDATQDVELTERFLRRKTPLGVYRFFQEEGYKDILREDCEDILNAAISGRGRGLNRDGKPVDASDLIKSY
jgi:hypothetical protein